MQPAFANVLPFPAPPVPADPNVADVVRDYLKLGEKSPERRARPHFREKERILRLFVATHGHFRIDEIKAIHLESWLEAMPVAGTTKVNRNRMVQTAFNWAAKKGLIARNPVRDVDVGDSAVRRNLTDAEYEQAFAACPPHFRDELTFLRLSGARPGEMANADWSDVTIDDASLTGDVLLDEHKTADKTGKPRIVAFGRELAERLLERRRRFFPGLQNGPIFLNSHGKRWTIGAWGRVWRKIRRKAGLPADAFLYGVRHAFGTRLVKAGVPMRTIAHLMGHASVQTTERNYDHAGQDRQWLREQAKAVEGLFGPDPKALS